MTCREAIDEFLLEYVEGKLTLSERIRFNLHLAICSHCRRYLDSYRKTLALTQASEKATEIAPSELPEELVRAILSARGAKGDPS